MIDRCELMEAALEGFPEGLALLSCKGEIAFWNQAAEHITGFSSMETMGRPIPSDLEPLFAGRNLHAEEPGNRPRTMRHFLVRTQHRSGNDLSLMMRSVVLRDALGVRVGTAVVFHRAEGVDALPHGDCSEESGVDAAHEEIAEQARQAFEDFAERGVPLGLLWVSVDQAHELRRTHGSRACETMMERVGHTLAHGLRPAEELGRWGDEEFLILSHEATPAAIAAHAQRLAGLARTTEFRWWGDRLSVTVSIGAALAMPADTLPQLFERAQAAMLGSIHAGGNHTTLAPERLTCSPL
jgi:diguanylate cyclase (GGDEF)-like protein/PAS domain S-box-containing protein